MQDFDQQPAPSHCESVTLHLFRSTGEPGWAYE
jgi:hypothetical protein